MSGRRLFRGSLAAFFWVVGAVGGYGKQQRPVPFLIFIFDRILGPVCGLRIPDWLYGSRAGAGPNLAQNSCYVPIWDFLAMADLLAHPVSARILPRARLVFAVRQRLWTP